jgi:hypothetical protein
VRLDAHERLSQLHRAVPRQRRPSHRAERRSVVRVVVVARASRVARGRDGDEIVDAVFVARASARRRVGASARVAFFG